MFSRLRPYTKYIAILITVILISILLTQISLNDVISTLTQIDLAYILAGFILYLCSYVLRAWRFQILLKNEVSLGELFHIECVHNMMNNLLPARTGELSYIYLLKKRNSHTTGEGLATLVVARIFDCIALASLFFITLLFIKDIPKIILGALWIIAIFSVLLLILLVLLLWGGRKFVAALQKLAIILHIEKKRSVCYLFEKGFETVDSLEKISLKKDYMPLIIQSLLIWGMNYLMAYLLIIGMGIHLSLLLVILGGTFILLTTVLPIQGICGFGTTETIWTLVFVPLGMSLNDAVVSGFCYHIIQIIYFCILGIYGWIQIRN